MPGLMASMVRCATGVVVATVLAAASIQPANAASSSESAVEIATPVGSIAVVDGSASFEILTRTDGSLGVQAPKQADAATDVSAPNASWSYTFSQDTTARIYAAAVAGSIGVIVEICNSIAPGWVQPFCSVVAAAIAPFVKAFAPNGRCLKITAEAKLGWPPLRVSVGYVECSA